MKVFLSVHNEVNALPENEWKGEKGEGRKCLQVGLFLMVSKENLPSTIKLICEWKIIEI